jgi:hypothetical protein
LLVGALLGSVAEAAETSRDLPSAFAPFAETGGGTRPSPVDGLPRPADLSLVWFDPSGSLPAGYSSVTREVDAIFRGLGIELSWRVGGNFGASDTPEVPVILLRRDPVAGRRSNRILGLVVPHQEPYRAVWVFQENVLRALGVREESPSWPDGVDRLARALGRVVAHEIVHAVAPDTPHAREGLMRHSFDRTFLLGENAPVDPSCAAAFVAALAARSQQTGARGALRLPDAPGQPEAPSLVGPGCAEADTKTFQSGTGACQ